MLFVDSATTKPIFYAITGNCWKDVTLLNIKMWVKFCMLTWKVFTEIITYCKWEKIRWANKLEQFLRVPRKFSCEYLAIVK